MKIINNKQFNGVEMYFESKPASAVLEILKSNKWRWHNTKKCWYAKDTEESRKVIELVTIKLGTKPTEEKTEKQTESGIKIGDIFVGSWGYEQTNVDCYQVVDIKGKSTVILREIGYEYVESIGSAMSSNVRPVKDDFLNDNLITKRVKDNYISLDFTLARLWDGKRSYYCSWYA